MPIMPCKHVLSGLLSLSAPALAATLLLSAALTPALPGQRGITALTKTKRAHVDALISPDGRTVVFRTQGKLGAVDTSSKKEIDLVTSNGLGDFFWAPSSSGVYYLDGTSVFFIARNGGTPTRIRAVTGTAIRIWSVDAKDNTIFGTRSDAQFRNHSVFTLATNGQSAAANIITNVNLHSDVHVNRAGNKIVFLRTVPLPRQPVEVRVADVDGKNDTLVHKAQGTEFASKPAWADVIRTVTFQKNDSSFARQLFKVDVNTKTVQPLTAKPGFHRGGTTNEQGRWLVHEAFTTNNRLVISVMPPLGGGRVMLEPETSWDLAGGQASIDAKGEKVAFAGRVIGTTGVPTQVYMIELDRDVRVTPQAEVGKAVKAEVPLANNERALLFVSQGVLPKIVKFLEFDYGIAIDPASMQLLAAGTGNGTTPLTYNTTIPNIAALKDLQVYLQAIRTTDDVKGDLSRYVAVQVF